MKERVEVRESVHRVTGYQRYMDDLSTTGVLHGAFVRIDCARARIKSVDTTRAGELSGVYRILTSADIPEPMPRYGALLADQPILAVGETRFWGEPVALVLAENEKTAREAARLVDVTYDELPPVLTAEDALREDAPLVLDPEIRPEDPLAQTNIMTEFPLSWGDVDSAHSSCDLIVENTYRAPFMHHFAMELFGCVAVPEDGGVSVTSAIQHPFVLRKVIAGMLDLPQNKVRIRATEAGGGFGARGYPKMECAAAYVAYRLNRSVKLSMTGEEGFMLAQREAARIHIKTGFTAEGKLVFQDITTDLLVGAYTDIAPRVVGKAGIMAAGPYVVPNARMMARGLYTHTTPTTAFRGFGASHAGFAVEGQMNEAAEKLGIDRVEIRLRNLPERGQQFIPHETPADGDWKAALRKLADAMEWNDPKPEGVGRGIAIGSKNSIPASASFARVRINTDGSITAYIGTTEMGQGARSAMPKIVARALDVPVDQVNLVQGDTGAVPFDFGTAGSRSTVTMGNALVDACANLTRKLQEIAARQAGVPAERVLVTGGGIVVGTNRKSFAELLAAEFGPGVADIEADGAFIGPKDPEHPLGGPTPFYEYLITGIELRIDRETGEVMLEKLANVTDVGTLINPVRAAGVDEGAATMGLGASLMEEIKFSPSGKILNPSSLDYRILTTMDAPKEMVTLFQENHDGAGPFGAKGMGEGAILAVAPAVADAIHDCIGIRMREIPFTAEKIWTALQERGKKSVSTQ